MNASNAKDYLPLVQALAEGKTIQYNWGVPDWMDVEEMSFCSPPTCYRIKPEPRSLWVVETEIGFINFEDETRARSYAGSIHPVTEYREVLP